MLPINPGSDSVEDAARPSPRKGGLRFSLRIFLVVAIVLSILVAFSMRRLQDYLDRQYRLVPTAFDVKSGRNILWTAKVGSWSVNGPTYHDGKVYVGTNNTAAYLPRYPANVDLGVLLCFDAADGTFLWQASSEKLPTGRVHDWPSMGILSRPCFEKDRLWYVTNRCELVCLDTEGFTDDQDDGEPQDPEVSTDGRTISTAEREADLVWRFDMMKELGVNPHNASSSSPCIDRDRVFVVTGHGVGVTHQQLDKTAPSFIALDKRTGKLLWSDDSPGLNILHGQWGSPVYGVIAGVPQVIFPGGDGWLYSFDPAGTADGKGKLLWKFDCNPKTTTWRLGGGGTRNNLLTRPTIHNGRIYVATGQEPEHGEGPGCVWCIDGSQRGDVSAELVFNKADPDKPIEHQRALACDETAGDFTRPNPNSAVLWEYTGTGAKQFEDQMHRSLSDVVIDGNLLFVTDFSGLLHCLDPDTGRAHWIYDCFAQCWSSPVVSANHVFVGNEDGDVDAFRLSANPDLAFPGDAPISRSQVPNSVYATPQIANRVLYILSRDTVYAIADPSLAQQ